LRNAGDKYFSLSGKLVFVLFLFYSQNLLSQFQQYQLQFKSITIDDGLTNNKVNAITKDKYGFMWFATNDGVCRYDGLNIRSYHLDPLNTRNRNTNHINYVYTDIKGDLWIGAFSLFRYDYMTDSLVHYSSLDTSLFLGRVRSIVNDDKGTMWIGTTKGLFSLYPEKDSVAYQQHPDHENFEILTMLPDKNLWLSTSAGLVKCIGIVDHPEHLETRVYTIQDGL